MTNFHPRFAVVGHPNKGKSTIVSALSQDDTIQVSNTPGTTKTFNSYPLKVDGKIIYELIDTPGFQRAREVLAYLHSHDVGADKRPQILREFVNKHKEDKRFHDEIELLTPILDGAGIIYVVDASKPYSKEYEAQMEILRWSGQPSMAILNYIDEDDFSDEWSFALRQYFNIVRSFDPLKFDIPEQISLLESMAQLNENWKDSIKKSIQLFKEYEEQKLKKASRLIANLVAKSLIKTMSFPYHDSITNKQEQSYKKKFEESFEKDELKLFQDLEKIFNHNLVNVQTSQEIFKNLQLFSKNSMELFGLSKDEMIKLGAVTGASIGAALDLFTVGHTLVLGAISGGVVGAVGAYLSFDSLFELKVLGGLFGKKRYLLGPVKNSNLAFIMIGRAFYLISKLSKLSHAKRKEQTIQLKDFKESYLDEKTKKQLEKFHSKLRKTKQLEPTLVDEYADVLYKLVEKTISYKS